VNISPHPQTTPFTYTFHFVRVGWGHRRNHPRQVPSQSVHRFRLPRGSKFTIPHRLRKWLLQQCYALTCYTVILAADLKACSPVNLILKYADDTNLLVPQCSDTSILDELEAIRNWTRLNKMQLNVKKTIELVFTTPTLASLYQIPYPI